MSRYFVLGWQSSKGRTKISCTGTTSSTNQPLKDSFHLYSRRSRLPQFQQSTGATTKDLEWAFIPWTSHPIKKGGSKTTCPVCITPVDFLCIHCNKKVTVFPVFSQDVTYQTLPGRKLFPARGSLVSDIPSGDGKTANLFLQCTAVNGILTNNDISTYSKHPLFIILWIWMGSFERTLTDIVMHCHSFKRSRILR
jgi:hypothetical protein